MRSRMKWLTVLVAGTTALAAGVSHASELDTLVRDLSGPDTSDRAAARQLLPRHGVQAMPLLLPLLDHDDIAVRRAAGNVLSDIVNVAAAPGHDDERAAVTSMLMEALEGKPTGRVAKRLLSLLAVATPAGQDVSRIAAYLEDAALRMAARDALQLAGSEEACAALVAALPNAEPAFACALLDSIGKMQVSASVPTLVAHTQSGNAQVRAAAALALAWTGDPSVANSMIDAYERADAETEEDAADALLRYADAMARRGGNWEMAMAIYRMVLNASDDKTARVMAIQGLGRFGDDTAVGDIMDAVKQSGSPDLGIAAIHALEGMEGKACSEAILTVAGDFPPECEYAAIAMLGRKRNALFVPVIARALEGNNPTLRRAAIEALGDSGVLEAMAPLVAVAESGAEGEQEAALTAAIALADGAASTSSGAEAGKAYVKLYQLAQDDAVRKKVLEGIARNPHPSAYGLVRKALNTPALGAEAVRALRGLFGPLAAAGKNEQALEVFELVAARDSSPATLLVLAGQLQGVKTDLDTTRLLGVVKSWHLIGPFKWESDADWERAFIGEPAVDLTATYAHGNDYLSWRPYATGDASGLVNLMGVIGAFDRVFAYAYTEISVEKAMDAQLRVGSDDGNRVWLNGQLVWDNNVDRGAAMDQDVVDVKLKQGINSILVKISQGAGGWNFCLRLTTPDGRAVPFAILER